MNWINDHVKNFLKYKIINYDPIRDVCQVIADSCLVLSSNFDQMINNDNVAFWRRMKYHATFAIHLLVMIKYAILAIYDDPYTIAMLGESMHVLANINFASRMFFSVQIILLPLKFTLGEIGDKFIADILVTISQLDTSLPLNRINNRKLKTKIWLISKLYTKSIPFTWIILPMAILYCIILVYLDSPVPVNPITLLVNGLFQHIWLKNVMEIALVGGLSFFYVMSMLHLRYKELIHLLKVNKVAGFLKVNQLYNQLVIEIKLCRRILNPIIGIIYLFVPLPIGFASQLVLQDNWLAKILALIGLFICLSSNFLIYYMASSICLMNKVILKLLYPIQFDKKPKTIRMRLKIDSFIDRLNEEFVGFYCLYAMKFNRKTFYKYIIGISVTYILINGLVNARRN